MGVHYIFSVDVWNVDIINGFFQDSIRLKNKFNRLVGFFYMSTIALNFNLSIFQGLHFRPVTPEHSRMTLHRCYTTHIHIPSQTDPPPSPCTVTLSADEWEEPKDLLRQPVWIVSPVKSAITPTLTGREGERAVETGGSPRVVCKGT